MILFILPLIALAASNLIGGIDYLFKLLFPPVPATVPLSQNYTPPFTGGQCANLGYTILLKIVSNDNQIGYITQQFNGDGRNGDRSGIIAFGNAQPALIGAFRGIDIQPDGQGRWTIDLLGTNQIRIYLDNYAVLKSNITIDEVFPRGFIDNCGNVPNPNPTLPIGGNGLPSSPPPVLYPPPNTNNNNWFPLIAGIAAVAATALTAATAAAAATAATAITAATAAATAATAAIASAPNGSTIQQQSQSQKLSADALVGIAQALAEVAKQIEGVEKEVRKLKTDEAKKEKDDAKKVIRYDFGSANRDGFIKLYPESNPDGFEATFVDVQIFNIPIGRGKYFGDKSPHFYKYQSLGQIHFVSPTFGILESREVDFARLSLNVPDNCFGFFYHFGLNGVINANLSAFYSKTEKQAV